MIKHILVLSCMLLAYQVNGQSLTGSPPRGVKDFVLEVQRMDLVKTLPVFKSYLKSYPEIEFAGFCESRRFLMLKMPESDLGLIEQTLQNMNLPYFIKQQSTVQQAISACEYPEEIELSKTAY